MAVCVGCGLEVNNGLLEVNVCGTPVIPNTTTGGIQCDTGTENGCLKVVLNDSHAGCGLAAASGALHVNNCKEGGILCGPTADDTSQCEYVNVQGQGAGACVAYTAADKAPAGNYKSPTDCDAQLGTCATVVGPDFASGGASPNCNGLIRTCDGLWSPPSQTSLNFSCGQTSKNGGSIDQILFPVGPQAARLGSPIDGFPPASNDLAFGSPNASNIIIVNAFDDTGGCNPIDAMSWTAFTTTFTIGAGEVWRVLLHERICTPANAPCTNGWAIQSAGYADNRGQGTRVVSIQINDNSTWRFGKNSNARMEAMITFQRVIGGPTAQATNAHLFSDFQYRNMGHAFNYRTTQYCGLRSTNDTLA